MILYHKIRERRTRGILCLLATFICLISQTNGVDADKALTGIGYRNQTNFDGYLKSSMLGGAEIFIKGQGMTAIATSNFPRYAFMGGMFGLEVDGETLTDDEAFSSAPANGKLAISTPSLLSLLNAEWSDFDGRGGNLGTGHSYDGILLEARITNADWVNPLQCETGSNCQIAYRRDFTPILHDVVPNQVYAGQRIDYWFDIMDVHTEYYEITPDGYFPVQELRIDRSNCDWDGLFDSRTRLTKLELGKLPAYVGEPKPTKSADVTARFVSGHAYKRWTSVHCSYDGTDCWHVRVHPKIESISASTGYQSGYQTLTISGQGLNGTDISITADGTACQVQTASTTELTCLTGANQSPTASSTDERPGQPGLVLTIYDPVDTDVTPAFDDFSAQVVEYSSQLVFDTTDRYDELVAETADTSILNDESFENSVSVQTKNYLTKMDGWFKAPATGDYRFYMSCDDECKLEFDATNYYGSGADYTLTNILQSTGAMDFRNYFIKKEFQFNSMSPLRSSYYALTEGRYYRIRGQHRQSESQSHFTVSLEARDAYTSGHSEGNREVQTFEINQTNVPETWSIEITDPSAWGQWFLQFTKTDATQQYVPIDATYNFYFNWDPAAICHYLTTDFFNTEVGAFVSCTRTMYNDDDETTDFNEANFIRYQVKLRKRIEGNSFSSVVATSTDPASTIEIKFHGDGDYSAVSTAPLAGSFTISCTDPETNNVDTTDELNIYWTGPYIAFMMSEKIPFLSSNVVGYNGSPEGTVNDEDRQLYNENYKRFQIEFSSELGNIPQCTIQSGTDNPITGESPTFASWTLEEGGQHLFFEPIPTDMLFSSVTTPQVLLTIDEIVGACANANCGYEYFEGSGEIYSQNFDPDILQIAILGTGDLPTTGLTVIFGGAPCGSETISGDSTSLSCTLDHAPFGGDHDVEVYGEYGIVKLADSLSPITVQVTVSAVSPSIELNQNGGDELTITGTGFPNQASYAQVIFDDGTHCTVTSSTPTEIRCTTSGFDKDILVAGETILFTITNSAPSMGVRRRFLDAVDFTSSLGVSASDFNPSVSSVSPTSLSPVLKGELVFTLSGYVFTMDASDFTVNMVQESDSSYLRQLNVISVDNSAKTLTVQFPGAASGTYSFQIKGLSGSLSCPADQIYIETIIELTDYSPRSGSTLGGTKLTLTGRHFGTVATDNPVKVGNNYCYVEETGDTEIICRIGDLSVQSATTDAQLIVFARTTEEMECNVSSSTCLFEYAEPSATVDSITSSFDTTTNSITVQISGSGFGTDSATTELLIDGHEQTLISVDDSSASFTITNVDDKSSSSIKFYTVEGNPNGASALATFDFLPNLVRISPSTGSFGGSLLTVTGVGFGINTADVNLFHVQSGASICTTVEVTAYGVFTCQTMAGLQILETDTLNLIIGIIQYVCSNTATPSDCSYQALYSDSPVIDSITLTDATSLAFVGSNFYTSADSSSCEMLGVTGTVSVASLTEATCTFEKGVPATDTAVSPSLTFVTGTDQDTAFSVQTISNPLVINSVQQDTVTSFAGGSSYTIQASGLANALIGSEANTIMICEQECVVDEDSSLESEATCTIPALMTTYSAEIYQMQEPQLIASTWTGTASQTELDKLSDGNNLDDYTDSSAPCYFQIQAKTGYVYQVSEARIFIDNLIDKTPYDHQLFLQGSDEAQETWTDLITYTGDIHEGWNTVVEEDSPFSYNTFRFYGDAIGSCRLGEVKLIGLEVLADTATQTTCSVNLTFDGKTTVLDNESSVTYDAQITSYLNSISPRFGSEKGGEEVVFTGHFNSGTPTVLIDGRTCDVTESTDTQITCTTADKPYDTILPEHPSLQIVIAGDTVDYNVATKGLTYTYVARWSDTDTWGGDFIPGEGDAVEIPSGRALLVDVDSTPILSFITVLGSLIFAPEADKAHERTFDAEYIIVNGGYLEIGTEEFPYDSKLTITMHGDEYSPALPIYGNKVIAVRNGRLEMHGVERSHAWTELYVTADVGATSITLNDVGAASLDWEIGEEIVIASTDFEGRHAEKRTITEVTNRDSNPVISFADALLYKHYAGVETYGDDTLEIRAEVGLLTRNVKYRGDEATSSLNKYGAHIMLASPGDESVVGKIENCEFFDVGQAFKLGRYPLHFHMIGTVTQSYIKNNAIHQTYNRATTLHGVHYLTIQNNVAYKVMGHAVFIEDAAETKNLIDNNLIIDTRRSDSLLNTDQSPASFWITHPDNILTNNHAAGSDRYGFWYDLQEHSTGPSFDINICPENTRLGEFRDNVAHSNGRYGLRIFHQLIPREKPCDDLVLNRNSASNPYGSNSPIIGEFHNLLSYKNHRNGAIAERMGAVHFINFKVADNKLAGIEFSETQFVELDDYTKIIGGLVVGRSANSEVGIDDASPHGIIGPRSEWFRIEDTSFFNFNFNNAAALGDCSHCWHASSTDMGARTVSTRGLKFDDDTVTKRIMYQYPFRGIFWDMDGSLTGLGVNSWATPNWQHNRWDECTVDEDLYNGLICDNTVQVRQIYFDNYQDFETFNNMDIYLAQLQLGLENELKESPDVLVDGVETTAFREYIFNDDNFANLFMVKNVWAVPFVTGKRYNVRWGNGLDFLGMQMHLSDRWTEQDQQVLFHSSHIDVREQINFYDLDTGDQINNMTYFDDSMTGANYVYNITDTREFGWRASIKDQDIKNLYIEGLRCSAPDPTLGCLETIEIIPVGDPMLWSQPLTWDFDTGVVPTGGDVTIPSGYWIVYDLEDSPVFDVITINGRLSFLNVELAAEFAVDTLPKLNLNAKHIFVRAGEFFIGSATVPFEFEAQITLHGARADAAILMSGTVEAGNKILANVMVTEFYGQKRDRMSRLLLPAYRGHQNVVVDPNLDWVAGDKIYFAPTNLHPWHHEYMEIEEYNAATGEITLTEELEYYHYGADASIADQYGGLDMRGEVILLTRSIRIVGDSSNDWGCTIVCSDLIEADRSIRTGIMIFDNVEVYRGGQEQTYKSAIRYEGAQLADSSVVDGSVVWGGNSKQLIIKASKNIKIQNSTFLGGEQVGVFLQAITNVHLDNIFVGDVKRRILNPKLFNIDKEGGIAFCSFLPGDKCYDSSIQNSIVAGVIYGGYVAPGHECGDTSSNKFRNNVAHSIAGAGAFIYPDPAVSSSLTCYEGSYFSAYKCIEGPLTTNYVTDELRIRNMLFVDNFMGVSLNVDGESNLKKIRMYDSEIYGEVDDVNDDCPNSADLQNCWCLNKMGMMLFHFGEKSKALHVNWPNELPIWGVVGNSIWGGDVELNNVNFNRFSSRTKCGARQRTIMRNPVAPDYIPMHKFKNSKFRDVQEQGMLHIDDPPQDWANPTDCGEWPCTGPQNIVLNFVGAQFTGLNRPMRTSSDFTVVSDLPSATNAYSSCETVNAWNAAYCLNNNLGVFLFESLDADTSDRTIQPVTLKCADTGYENTVNSFMDHAWDGFYTSQLRLSRFPMQVETNHECVLYMSGTPPNKMRYTLKADDGWIQIRLYYPNAGAYQVYADGELQAETAWDQRLGRPGPITKTKGCGEWRFVAIENYLDFYLTAGCEVKVEPLDQIRTSVRLSWTLDEFYADGGTTTFTDRVAATLGVPAWRIKTVAVYEGSVVIEFFLLSDIEALDPIQELNDLGAKLAEKLTSAQDDWLGAPILDVSQQGQIIVQNIVDDTEATGNKGTSTLIADWLNQREEQEQENSNQSQDDDEASSDTETSTSSSNDDDEESDEDEDASIDDPIEVVKTKEKTKVTVRQQQITAIEEDDNDDNFIAIILVIIVCVIFIAAVAFLVRLICKKQKSIVVSKNSTNGETQKSRMTAREDRNDIFAADNPIDLTKVNQQDSVQSGQVNEAQFSAECIDYMEMTKYQKKKKFSIAAPQTETTPSFTPAPGASYDQVPDESVNFPTNGVRQDSDHRLFATSQKISDLRATVQELGDDENNGEQKKEEKELKLPMIRLKTTDIGAMFK